MKLDGYCCIFNITTAEFVLFLSRAMLDSSSPQTPENRGINEVSEFFNPSMNDKSSGRQELPPDFQKKESIASGQSSNQSPPTPNKAAKREFLLELLGVLTLVVGMVGYAAYLFWTDPPVLPTTTQALSLPPQPKKNPSPLPSLPPLPKAKKAAVNGQELYQRSPSQGTYYAESAEFAASHREVASNNGRFCIKVVDGPKVQASGYEKIVVSSLSFRNDGIYIDATGDKLRLDSSSSEMRDRITLWQLLEPKVDLTSEMEECLAKSGGYSKTLQGQFVNGG